MAYFNNKRRGKSFIFNCQQTEYWDLHFYGGAVYFGNISLLLLQQKGKIKEHERSDGIISKLVAASLGPDNQEFQRVCWGQGSGGKR